MTLLEMMKQKYPDCEEYDEEGIIFTNNNGLVVTVNKGKDANGNTGWYYGIVYVDVQGKMSEYCQTGCYSYAKAPSKQMSQSVLERHWSEEHYPLHQAENCKSGWHMTGSRCVTSMVEFNELNNAKVGV